MVEQETYRFQMTHRTTFCEWQWGEDASEWKTQSLPVSLIPSFPAWTPGTYDLTFAGAGTS